MWSAVDANMDLGTIVSIAVFASMTLSSPNVTCVGKQGFASMELKPTGWLSPALIVIVMHLIILPENRPTRKWIGF